MRVPRSAGANPLVAALVETVVSLELASDDLIDPDFEVDLMETIASTLQEMSDEQRADFTRELKKHIATTKSAARKKLLRELPEALGLVDEE